jgi:hypothetical protein
MKIQTNFTSEQCPLFVSRFLNSLGTPWSGEPVKNLEDHRRSATLKSNSCREAALEYLAMGWSPIPLCPHDHKTTGKEGLPKGHADKCKSPGKAGPCPLSDYADAPQVA